MFLASKLFKEFSKARIIAQGYHRAKHNSNLGKGEYESLTPNQIETLGRKIAKAETEIAKLLFNDKRELNLDRYLPYRYMQRYLEIIIEDKARDQLQLAKKATVFFCNDTFLTAASLIYSPKNICLASVLMALSTLNYGVPGEEGYSMDALLERIKDKCQTEITDTTQWYRMIDRRLDLKDVTEIIKKVNQYYAKVKTNN